MKKQKKTAKELEAALKEMTENYWSAAQLYTRRDSELKESKELCAQYRGNLTVAEMRIGLLENALRTALGAIQERDATVLKITQALQPQLQIISGYTRNAEQSVAPLDRDRR